jgi:hypothetical protein
VAARRQRTAGYNVIIKAWVPLAVRVIAAHKAAHGEHLVKEEA